MSQDRILPEFFDIGLKGNYFNTGTGPVSVTGGNHFRMLGVNPGGSGVLVCLHRLRFFCSTPSEFVELRVNPVAGLPGGAPLPVPSQRLGKPSSVVVVTADISATPMSGGALNPYQIPMKIGEMVEFEIPTTRILPPGTSIGIDYNNATGGPSNVVAIIDWFEVPVVT